MYIRPLRLQGFGSASGGYDGAVVVTMSVIGPQASKMVDTKSLPSDVVATGESSTSTAVVAP